MKIMAEFFPAPPHWSPYAATLAKPVKNTPPQSSSESVRSRTSLRDKTTSFFSRSRSTTGPTRHSPSQPSTGVDYVSAPRPHTARSATSSPQRTEPLGTIRHSILGSRRRDQHLESINRSNATISSLSSARNDSVSSAGRESFRKEEECTLPCLVFSLMYMLTKECRS